MDKNYKDGFADDFEAMDLADLDLSVRAYNCLRRIGINTCGELAEMTQTDLRSVRNLGNRCFDEIMIKLSEYGRALELGSPEDTAKKLRFKPSLSSQIRSAGYYAESQEVKKAVLESDALRNETLHICYGIPGYTLLSREDKIKLYDLVKKSVSMNLNRNKDSAPER